MNNMLIAQSGGPTVAINASLSGAIKRAMKCPEIDQILGASNGLEGILKETFVDFRNLIFQEEDFVRMKETPAMILGSCRRRLPEHPDETYEQVLQIFRKHEIKYFYYIGGNDSMDTVLKLSRYFDSIGEDIRVVGIPKTIDNDLACTDHTPGFGSAARYIAVSLAEIACDSMIYDIESITIVEIMGRNAGWLTAASALARRKGCTAPHLICLPEVPFDETAFLEKMKQLKQQHKQIIIAVSEGIKDGDGNYLSASSKRVDAFGHQILQGAGQYLKDLLEKQFDCKLRAIELNVLQRSASHLKSQTDIEEACRIGAEAVSLGIKGKSGVMATFVRVSNYPYLIRYGYEPVENIANVEKKIPLEMIGDMDVTDELIEYLKPLIQNPGEKIQGIPDYFVLHEEDWDMHA